MSKETIENKIKRIEARNERMRLRNEQLSAVKKVEEEMEDLTGKTLTIEICIHCHNYQHRLCWMLSSLLQQKGDIPNIIVNISYGENNGNPTTEEVCEFFRKKGLNITQTIIPPDQVHNRAYARNIQVSKVEADWMLFVDSDMVYDPYFFEDIQNQLKGKLQKVSKVMGADRVSLDIPFCIKYFEEDKRKYPCVIKNVAEIPAKWPIKWVTGRQTAAGYFQLAKVKAIQTIAKGKYVVHPRDIWRATRSDKRFRMRMGGRQPIMVKPQYHLNHDRGGPDIQR